MQPTPVFLPGESQGWGSLLGCCLWGHTELDMTEAAATTWLHVWILDLYKDESALVACSSGNRQKEIKLIFSPIKWWLLLLNQNHIQSSVQLLSHVRLFVTPWTTARQASLSITNSQSPPKPMSIESVMPSSHLSLCHSFLLLPPIPRSIRVFSNESTLHMRWPKYWSFSFSISPSNEHPGLIIFRMDWLDLLAVQGTLKSLLQHHS